MSRPFSSTSGVVARDAGIARCRRSWMRCRDCDEAPCVTVPRLRRVVPEYGKNDRSCGQSTAGKYSRIAHRRARFGTGRGPFGTFGFPYIYAGPRNRLTTHGVAGVNGHSRQLRTNKAYVHIDQCWRGWYRPFRHCFSPPLVDVMGEGLRTGCSDNLIKRFGAIARIIKDRSITSPRGRRLVARMTSMTRCRMRAGTQDGAAASAGHTGQRRMGTSMGSAPGIVTMQARPAGTFSGFSGGKAR